MLTDSGSQTGHLPKIRTRKIEDRGWRKREKRKKELKKEFESVRMN